MRLEEAKEFYFRYDGQGFHMSREEPQKYEEFRSLPIGEDTLSQWDEEMLKERFAALWTNPDRVWIKFERIITILRRKRCDSELWGKRLLEEMKRMVSLDKRNKILIIEDMAGTDTELRGGVCFFCTNTDLEMEMNDVMEKLMDFTCSEADNTDGWGWKDVSGRYNRAVKLYREACHKWRQ